MVRKIYLLVVMMAVLWSCNDDVTREADQLFNGGQYTEAVESYTEYLTTNPKDIKSLYNRGRAYEELGQSENARKDFSAVLDIDGDNVNANMSMGKYWYEKKSYKRAINFFDKVIQIDGRVSMAYMLKGRSYHQMGEFEDAMQGYNLSINFDKKNAEAFLYRGALRVALNQMRKACADLTRAEALGSPDAGAALAKHCR